MQISDKKIIVGIAVVAAVALYVYILPENEGGFSVSLIFAAVLFFLYLVITGKLYRYSHLIFILSIASVAIRFANAFLIQKIVYGGFYEGGDIYFYNDIGTQYLLSVRNNTFDFARQYLVNMPFGTQNFSMLTGLLYFSLGGPTLEGAAVAGAFLASIGSYLVLQTFRTAFPKSNAKIFAFLIFLYPSLIFWTSLHLKEAWVYFYLCLATYGVNLLFSKQVVKGVLCSLAGIYFGFHIKPYIFLFFIFALVFLIVFEKRGGLYWRYFFKPAIIIGVLYLSYVSFIFAHQHFLHEPFEEGLTTLQRVAQIKEAFATGGSRIELKPMLSWDDIVDLPYNIISVLFRPFIFEAHNIVSMVAGIENAFLLILLVIAFVRFPRNFPKSGLYFFALSYIIIFTLMFAFVVANLGTMVRLKIYILPFLFMLIAHHLTNRPPPSETTEVTESKGSEGKAGFE